MSRSYLEGAAGVVAPENIRSVPDHPVCAGFGGFASSFSSRFVNARFLCVFVSLWLLTNAI